jgi:hypothetical protein
MTETVSQSEISAEWAHISKVNGGAADFSILAASQATLGPQELSDFSASFVAGVPAPDVDLQLPSAPPWVTFGKHESAGARFVSVTVQFPWDGVDQRGRPIWSRDFYVFRYDAAARGDLSYQSLYRSVQGLKLAGQGGQPLLDGRPLLLKADPQPMDELATVIERYGLERLAAIAAALLDAPVAVGGTGSLWLAQRLQLLDAIAALLPRGFRADLSASSAVSGLNVPKMRLILTDEEDSSHQQMHLASPGAPLWSEGAREYYELLLRMAQNRELPAVLRYLWSHWEALSFITREATP